MRELMAYSRMRPVGRVEEGASGEGRLAALYSCVSRASDTISLFCSESLFL